MKILLDECLPVDFRHCFQSHDAHTTQWARFKGLKNGVLLRAAEVAGYGAFLTVDESIRYQQNLDGMTISMILIRSRSNRMEDLRPLVPAILKVLESIDSGKVVTIG
jgi:predicted nuclease of predicted toxin-antitoxin system